METQAMLLFQGLSYKNNAQGTLTYVVNTTWCVESI